MKKRYLKFWGTRGSCSVSGPDYAHFGGNTCCLEVRYDDTLLIIDAGTGIRPFGAHLRDTHIALFLSHTHWDHIIGFPFFEPIYRPETHITIWAPQSPHRPCRELFQQLLSREFFPVKLEEIHAHLSFRALSPTEPIPIGPLFIHSHPTEHPGATYCFKIQTPHQTITYVTDHEQPATPSPSYINFHRGSDLFIHEVQYSSEEYIHKKGWGHSSLAHAIHLVDQIRPRHWYVTHHDPQHTDAQLRALETQARDQLAHKQIPCPVDWLPDGHVLPLL